MCRRAQHFALYRNEDQDDQQDQLHVGGSDVRTAPGALS